MSKRSHRWLTRKWQGGHTEVSRVFRNICKCVPHRWPKVLYVDPGHEFIVEVTREMAEHGVRI